MRRGELWWAALEDKRPVVLLSDGPGQHMRMARIVAPATEAERQGFVLMSGDQAIDADERRRIVDSAGPDVRAIGIEVFFGTREGLAQTGVVRVALPLNPKIFCTWILSLSDDYLIERIGVLSPLKQHELDIAMALSGTG
jgi:mRNA interferase MazF